MIFKKQIFQLNVLKKLLNEEHSCVSLIPTTRILSLPPSFLNDTKRGIFFMLNKALKKYDQHLDGILIGYQNVKILMDDRTGLIPMGVANIRVNVSIEFYVFQPKIGGLLKGVVNKKSSSHIGCLVHKYFNASILKPDDVDLENWDYKDINVNDQIKFRVSDLDFTGYVPRIEGVISTDDLNDDCKLGPNQDDLAGDDTSDNEDYEKELLDSDEFWAKKLNKTNWIPEINIEDSQKNSRKRTHTKMTSPEPSENNSEDDILMHKKKKRKKNEELHETSVDEVLPIKSKENEEVRNSAAETEINTTDGPKAKRKSKGKASNVLDVDSCDNNKAQLEEKEKVDVIAKTFSKPKDDSVSNKKKRKRNCDTVDEKNATETQDPPRKKKKVESITSPSYFESTPKTSKKLSEIDRLIQKRISQVEKQSESDSGVGLESKEGLRSPISYKSPSPKKSKKLDNSIQRRVKDSEEKSVSSEKDKSDTGSLVTMDTSALQMSLLKEVMKNYQVKDRDRHQSEAETGEEERKTPNNSEKKEKKKRSSTKNKESEKSHTGEKGKDEPVENGDSEDLIKSISKQMLKELDEYDLEEDTLFRTPKRSKKGSISIAGKDLNNLLKSGEKKVEKKKVEKEKGETEAKKSESTEVSKDLTVVNHVASHDGKLETSSERLKQVNATPKESKNKEIKSMPKKEKKIKDNREEKSEEMSAEDGFGSLYTKLLQDAMSNINGGSSDSKEKKKKKKRKESAGERGSGDKAKKRHKNEKKHKKKKKVKESDERSSQVDEEGNSKKKKKETSKQKKAK